MGAKLSRKKSEGGTAAETTGPSVEQNAEDLSENAEQKPDNETPTAQPDSSTSFLGTITQAVEETVNTVTEQISAPVEDVVNKGIKAVESALVAVNLNAKEPGAPKPEPERIQESPEPPLPSEPTLLDDVLQTRPMSDDVALERESETITGQMEEDLSNPASTENKDLLERLDTMVTPSADLLDCKLTYESTIPNSDLSVTLGDVGQEACEVVDPVNLI